MIVLGRRDLDPFIADHPGIKDRALEALASNRAGRRRSLFGGKAPASGSAHPRLLELVDSAPERRSGLAVTPKISQSTLAAMIGVSRENVNRALSLRSTARTVRKMALRPRGRGPAAPADVEGLATSDPPRPTCVEPTGRLVIVPTACAATSHLIGDRAS